MNWLDNQGAKLHSKFMETNQKENDSEMKFSEWG